MSRRMRFSICLEVMERYLKANLLTTAGFVSGEAIYARARSQEITLYAHRVHVFYRNSRRTVLNKWSTILFINIEARRAK